MTDQGQLYLCQADEHSDAATNPQTDDDAKATKTLDASSFHTAFPPTTGRTASDLPPQWQQHAAMIHSGDNNNDDTHAVLDMRHLVSALHVGAITSMDVAVRKPLVVSAGDDRTVRVWNFQSRELEVLKQFDEAATCVAIHPSGHFLLLAFPDKLLLMYLMRDDMRALKELPLRGCRECCFSHGGHLFAAVNGNHVQLYNTVLPDSVSTLKGHGARVHCIRWSNADLTLVSCSQDGEYSGVAGRRRARYCVCQGVTGEKARGVPNSVTVEKVITTGEGGGAYRHL